MTAVGSTSLDFALTNVGGLVPHQVQIYRERVATVGISYLGGNRGCRGGIWHRYHSIQAYKPSMSRT
ncbi:hypothetical protein C8Q74DRAFT_1255246 [Fomes fomentarius]|nr:hypothetical protein C8Q74DRAFT_1255246 [Fomes fomentarius]